VAADALSTTTPRLASARRISVEWTEFIRPDRRGRLRIEDVDAEDLAAAFGTPTYVTSEHQIRRNYRRFRDAFAALYPNVAVLYATKANNDLAVRRILTSEGAGGDCFGLGELTISLLAGTPADRLVLNGSNKGVAELQAAIDLGVTINVDDPSELGLLKDLARQRGKRARVRLRVLPFSYADPASLPDDLATIAADRSHDKWGMDRSTVATVLPDALRAAELDLAGLHFHVSRLRPTTEHFALAIDMIVEAIAELRDAYGWEPRDLDIGGGFAHERDPESGQPAGDHRVASPEDYAAAIVGRLRAGLERFGLREPQLILEPGRRLVSNATVLLTRVGVIKRLPSSGTTWVNVDASTNHALRAELQGYRYEIVHATRVTQPVSVTANITGPTCTIDLLGEQRTLPETGPGDLLAILDVGGYAEVFATQFNAIPRPATVLVDGERADVIRRRETIEDLVALQSIPLRLLAGPNA